MKLFFLTNMYSTPEIKTFGLGSKIQDMALWDEPNKVCVPYSVFGL